MYDLGNFQSLFQLSVALHLVAEWANVPRIEAHYQEKNRRELGWRLRIYGKYFEEFEDADFSEENIADFFEPVKPFSLQQRTKFLRLLIHFGTVYSTLMLLLSSFLAETKVTGTTIIIFVGLVFVPTLYFLLTIVRSVKKAHESHKALLESIIEPAEKAHKEFSEEFVRPALKSYMDASKKGERDAMIRYRNKYRKLQKDRKSFIEDRVAQFTEQNRTNIGNSV